VSALRSIPAQCVSETELLSLREHVTHYQKELASYKEPAQADGRRIREQD